MNWSDVAKPLFQHEVVEVHRLNGSRLRTFQHRHSDTRSLLLPCILNVSSRIETTTDEIECVYIVPDEKSMES